MVTVSEAWINRSEVINESAEITYYVTDAADEAAVKAAVAADIGNAYGDLVLRNTRITARLSETSWAVIAYYTKEPWIWPDSQITFDTSGGTEHITQAIETINSYGSKATTENKSTIGFDGRSVRGCDIVVPVYKWSETKYFYDFQITDAYKTILRNLTGRVNDDTFKGFAAGEVLFLGVSGTRGGDFGNASWELLFNFASSPNRTGIEIGDITGVAKKGWEYMDIRYADTPDLTNYQVLRKPTAVYIHRVYYDGDFSTLAIGT